MRTISFVGIGLTILCLSFIGLLPAQQPAPQATPAAAPMTQEQKDAIFQAQFDALAGEKNFVIGRQPMMNFFPPQPKVKVPEGYTAIFNGENLTGWHASTTNHHGVAPDFRVVNGAIVGSQGAGFGEGGILLTDKSYRNFDLYMEIKPDYGCDGGIFFRSTEAGHAYQVTLDYLPGGGMGSLITEMINDVGPQNTRATMLAAKEQMINAALGIRGGGGGQARGRGQGQPGAAGAPGQPGMAAVQPGGRGAGGAAGAPGAPGAGGRGGAPRTPVVGGIPLGLPDLPQGDAPWMKVWKREAWNSVRVRVEGDIPHVTIWINDQVITDRQEQTNRAENNMVSGPIAIQMHGGNRWVQAGFWRWRNIGMKELP